MKIPTKQSVDSDDSVGAPIFSSKTDYFSLVLIAESHFSHFIIEVKITILTLLK